jgi:hypothetical protein
MANVIFMEPGTDATQDTSFYSTIAGTVTSDATQYYTGTRSLKCHANFIGSVAHAGVPAVLVDAGRRISCRIFTDQLPSSPSPFFSLTQTGFGGLVCGVYLKTDGTLSIEPIGATSAVGSTVLAINTWYRITLSYVITSSTVFQFSLFINGIHEVDATAGTLTYTSATDFQLSTGGNTANRNIWFDDIYIDNGSDYSDPGNIQVTNKRSFSNGTTTGFTSQIGSGGSGYGSGHAPQVNEQPLNTANGWSMVGAGAAVTEEYNIEWLTVGDVAIPAGSTLVDVAGWVYASSLASETAQIIVDGTTSNIVLTSANTMFTKSSATPTAYPAGSGSDVGIITSTGLTTVSLYECGMLIAYTPPVGSPAKLIFTHE